MRRLGVQDVLLLVAAVEWDAAARCSVTARYAREFEEERDGRARRNMLAFAAGPGTNGGHLGLGCLGVSSPCPKRALSLSHEIRVVRVRTWGRPLFCDPDPTFVGAELQVSPGSPCFGIGHQAGTSSDGGTGAIWGMHLGVGI